MQTSQKHSTSAGIPYSHHHYQISQSNSFHDNNSLHNQGTILEQYSTLESSKATNVFTGYDSPSCASVSSNSNRSPFSQQNSHSYQSSENNNGSPISVYSSADESYELKHKLKLLEISLLGPESDIIDSYHHYASPKVAEYNWSEIEAMIPNLDLKEVLIQCAQAVSDGDIQTAEGLMNKVLAKMVSVSGDPIQRLGAYMLEGLRARLESSGSLIYKSLKCEQPTSKELMSYMHILYQVSPYWKFAYISSNVVIGEAMENESRIHIIDFQIAQGTQWLLLMHALARRENPPLFIRVTGIDDSQSFHARGGGLEIVGKRLSDYARSCGIPFEFRSVAISGSEVELEDLIIKPDESLAVNFPFVLHHMSDESVSTENHRDRLLRLVKRLSPKIVTLVEQESNTNTCPFYQRFVETLNYYTAMFESIDVALPRDDKKRISAEQNCLARDVVNMIACEGAERVERHEVFGKWKSRFLMAGFLPCPLSPSVTGSVRNMLNEFNENYRVHETDVALYLAWKNRLMCTSSAWRCY